jgi:hypothetical protein
MRGAATTLQTEKTEVFRLPSGTPGVRLSVTPILQELLHECNSFRKAVRVARILRAARIAGPIIAVMDAVGNDSHQQLAEDLTSELLRLKAVEREYFVTVRALAVSVERLLQITRGDTLEISDANLADAPDLQAWRNADRNSVEIKVSR